MYLPPPRGGRLRLFAHVHAASIEKTLCAREFLLGRVGAEVVLDEAAAERIKKESPPPAAFTAAPNPPQLDNGVGQDVAALSPQQVRAVLASKLLSLVQGHSKVRCVPFDVGQLPDLLLHSDLLAVHVHVGLWMHHIRMSASQALVRQDMHRSLHTCMRKSHNARVEYNVP